MALAGCGLSDIKDWSRPFARLTPDQRVRANLARGMHDFTVHDDFTHTVNRGVGKSLACAVGRQVSRKGLKGLVFATSHEDILPFLQPACVVHVQQIGASSAAKAGARKVSAALYWRDDNLRGNTPKPSISIKESAPSNLLPGCLDRRHFWPCPADVRQSYKVWMSQRHQRCMTQRSTGGKCLKNRRRGDVGRRVMALYQASEDNGYYPGKIAKVNTDETFVVKFDDGDVDKAVQPRHTYFQD